MNIAITVGVRLLAALALTLFADALVFRTGWYGRMLNPESSTAAYEQILAYERSQQKPGESRVLVIGDSRTGFMARVADEAGAPYHMRFGNAATGGAPPRCWYYLIRDLDPGASAYSAVMVPLDYYEDEEISDDLRERVADLSIAGMRLRLSDTAEFIASYASVDTRWQALRGLLWKSFTLKHDLIDLLNSPRRRFSAIRYVHNWHEWVYQYRGEAKSMEGLEIDWDRREIKFPAALPEKERQPFRDIVDAGPLRTTGWLAEYRRHWLGRIASHYRGSRTKVIFFRLPRAPIPRPASWLSSKTSVIRELAQQPNVKLADETLFAPIEQPKYFIDPWHLNREGMEWFSRKVAELARQLGSQP